MLNRFYVLSVSLLLVVLFQNCSGVGFNQVGAKAEAADAFGEDLSSIIPSDPSLPSDPHTDPLEREMKKNEACRVLFDGVDSTAFPETNKVKLSGIHEDVIVANAKELMVTGIVKSVTAINVGVAKISGIHGSLCLMADEISGISGIQSSPRADVAIIGPTDRLGLAGHIVGIHNSDLVIRNFHVKSIGGVGKSLHIFGGKVDRLSGIFSEVHLYDGAEIVKRSGINKVVVHP